MKFQSENKNAGTATGGTGILTRNLTHCGDRNKLQVTGYEWQAAGVFVSVIVVVVGIVVDGSLVENNRFRYRFRPRPR